MTRLALIASLVGAGFLWQQPPEGAPPLSLQRKLQEIERRVPQWVAAGGDHASLTPLGEKVTRSLAARRYSEAETVADQILARLDAPVTAKPRRPAVRVAPGLSLPREHAPGLKAFTDVMDLFEAQQMRVFGFPANWRDLEPAPRVFALEESVGKPLTLLLPRYPKLDAVVLLLRMIDTNARSLPDDLADRRFDDPDLLARFEGLVEAITRQPSIGRVTHVLVGNEVDAYLGQHRAELPEFAVFYRRAVELFHRRLPGAKVGTVLTYAGVRGWPELTQALAPASDFMDYTYYPIADAPGGEVSRRWQMRPVGDVEPDLAFLAEKAAGKPFAFSEVGYSASPLNGSSEAQQADFVRAVFRSLERQHREGKLEFLLFHTAHDYPPEFCAGYAAQQKLEPSKEFCAFVESLGLRRYATGEPRPGWDALVEGVRRWAEPQH